jgi:alpha-1,6-mannosyltransferase
VISARSRFWTWTALGTGASVLVVLSGGRLLGSPATRWWFEPHLAGARVLFYLGVAAMCVAWLGLGWVLHAVPARWLWLCGALWCLPLALGPVLFSRDLYSYLAQGEILHLGLNPYGVAPAALAAHGQAHLLGAVSPFWRHTTAPYGPLFLGLVAPIAGAMSAHLIGGVLLARVLDLVGIGLVGAFVPRLARALGADPRRAAWLAALSPLVLLQLIAAGHNDALMVGVMVAGVALAVDGRRFTGIAVCALAAGIKVPALAAVAFIAVAWALERWRSGDRRGALLELGRAGAITVVVLAAVSVATGADAHWLTTGVFSTPQKVHLAITPGTNIGYTVASLLHDVGIGAATRSLEDAFGALTAVLTAVIGLWLLWRVRRGRLVLYLGLFLLAAALFGPAAWPWYLTWGLALLAVCPQTQRSWALVAALTIPVFLVKPDGILLLSVTASPAVLVVYLVLAGVAWRSFRRRRRGSPAAGGRAVSPRPTVESLT